MLKPNIKNRIVVTILFAFLWNICNAQNGYKTGDIIFQSSQSHQSKGIQLATHSKFSHVGMVVLKNGQAYVLEAVEPVKLTPIQEWISHGKGSYFEVMRVKTALNYSQEKLDSTIAACTDNIHYDLYFDWSDEKLYCSELVWKIYERVFDIILCPLRKMESFDLSDPIVKMLLKERYGNDVPLNELVVSPEDIYRSEFLMRVY